MSLGEGFGVGFRWVLGGGVPVANKRKGEGGGEGGGWDRNRQRNRQVNAQALSKLPFSNLPFSFSFSPRRKVSSDNSEKDYGARGRGAIGLRGSERFWGHRGWGSPRGSLR